MSSKTIRKKTLSLFMTLVMIFGLLPAAVLATGDSAVQIESSGSAPVYYTWNGTTNAFPATSTDTQPNTTNSPANGAPLVTTAKTIEKTNLENQFKITLNVETTQRIETTTTSPDASVVLVFDLSLSMDGKPLADAKDAAKKFLANFLGFSDANLTAPDTTYTDAGAARWVSVVTFNDKGYLKYDWQDLHGTSKADTQARLNSLFSTIAGFTAKTAATNTDGGLQSAEAQWAKFIGTGGDNLGQSAVTNRFTVLLTDGAPNNSGTTPSGAGYSYPSTYTPKSSKHFDNPALRAGKLMAATPSGYATKLYSIFFDTSSSGSAGSTATSFAWLQSLSNQAVLASNAATLNTAFSTIIDFIRLAVDAWKVNDPMGPYMNVPAPILTGHDSQAVTVSGITLIWDLRADLANATFKNYPSGTAATYAQYQANPNNAYTISYSLSYNVILNNLDVNVLPNTYYKTNGRTTLTYFLMKNSQYIDNSGTVMTTAAPLTLDFKVPAVKSLFTNVTLTKVAHHSGQGLPGAVFTLTANGGTWSRQATSTANGTVTFQNVPSGHSYTLSETSAPAPYDAAAGTATLNVSWGAGTWTAGGIVANGKVENRLNPQNLTYTVKKVWQGGQTKPVTIHIKQGGTDVHVQTLNGSESPAWQLTKTLPSVDPDTGNPISYTVTEDPVEGFSTLVSPFDSNRVATVTNTVAVNRDLTITKTWVAPAGARTAVNAILFAQSANVARAPFGAPIALNSGNGWSVTLSVPTYDGAGAAYTYTVEEQGANSGSITLDENIFTVSISGTAITNTIQQRATTASFTKQWKVAALSESERTALTADFELFADGTATGVVATLNADQTGATFQSLPMFALGETVGTLTLPADGHAISYHVEEVSVSDPRIVRTNDGNAFTNTLTGTTSVSVNKNWDIPEGFFENGAPEITILLVKNGAATNDTLALNEGNGWSGSFDDLAKYDGNGALISYTVKEQGANQAGTAITLNGQDLSVSITGSAENGFTVTNSAIGSTSFSVYKDWIDGSNARETRPASIDISLFADGQLVATATLTSADAVGGNVNRWSHTFGQLPAFRGTSAIVYTVAETDAQGNILSSFPAAREGDRYTVKVSGGTVTNSLTPRNDVEIPVTKLWVDGGNAQGTRPASVTVRLTGTPVLPFAEKHLSLNEGNGWSDKFSNLPRYVAATGEEIHYGVEEVSVNGYTSAITGSPAEGYTVTNTLDIPTVSIPVNKVWVDGGADHSDHSVTVILLRNGTPTGQSVTLNAGTGWSSAFSGLPIYSADYQTADTYTVDETEVPDGYTKQVNGGTITNTIHDPKTELTLVKRWIGPVADRPDEIILGLFRTSGSQTEAAFVQNVTLTAEENWTATVSGLPTRDGAGSLYTYSVQERVGDGYQTGGTAIFGDNVYNISAAGLTVTNTVNQDSVTVEGDKRWELGDRELRLPDEITIRLYQDGSPTDRTVTLTGGEDGWRFFFGELEKYALGGTGDGHAYTYSVREVGADANGDIAFGVQHFKVSGGEKIGGSDSERDGHYDLTNTYVSTDHYYYKVTAHYTTHNTATGTDSTETVTVLAQAEGSVGETVTRTGSEYPVHNGNSYSFDSGAAGNVLSATLAEANHTYELVLFYTRSFTPDTPPDEPPYEPPYNPPPSNPPTPTDPPAVDIPEEESPLGPDAPVGEVPPELPAEQATDAADIGEEVVPRGRLPQTGTTRSERLAADPSFTLGALALSLSLAAAGLAIAVGRRREEDFED